MNASKNCLRQIYIWDKVSKNRLSKICGRQSLKIRKKADHIPSDVLKAVFHKFY